MLAYDFGALEADGESLEPRERELTVAVLGVMVRDLSDDLSGVERRALLDRGVLLAGLRALSEQEAVALIAVDRLGWEQRELADRLGIDFGRLRETLFNARKLFYGVVRHAIGVEIDEEERARLHAYLAGELPGRERRLARRHLSHCHSCQALVREQQRFTTVAHQLLAPLPFVLGGRVLVKPATVKGAAVAAAPSATGLLGQAGAAKALAATAALLGAGVGVNAALSLRADEPVGAIAGLPAPSRLVTRVTVDRPSTPAPSGAKRSRRSSTKSPASRAHRSRKQRRSSDGSARGDGTSDAREHQPVDHESAARHQAGPPLLRGHRLAGRRRASLGSRRREREAHVAKERAGAR